jgi:hypothetical protein
MNSKETGGDKVAHDPLKRLKQAIWLYFFLLIFEGALRKWVLPGFSTPLLIIRDPIAIWLIVTAYNRGVLKANYYIVATWAVMFTAFCAAMLVGHGNLYVALFGLRICVLHFPLIFLIGRVFNQEDVVKMGRMLLWISIPMTFLIIQQFYSPQTAWINKGLGGSMETGGYWGAEGYFRPPGTFSFTTGVTQFYGLLGAFVFFFWLADSKLVRKWLLMAATVALVLSIPFSISRTLFFTVAITFAFATIASIRKPKYLIRFGAALIGGWALLAILSTFDFYKTGAEIFAVRFEGANQREGGVEGVFFDRFLGALFGVVMGSGNIPFWGFGLGIGTNVGSMLMTGRVMFLIAEGEWGRLIGEMGYFMGVIAIVVRAMVSVKLLVRSISELVRQNFLPWMLTSFAFLIILQGQWAQPTALGFAVLSGGLVIASFRDRKRKKFRLA